MAKLDKKARKISGGQLYQISRTRYPYIPVNEIDNALRATGYKLVDERRQAKMANFLSIYGGSK